MLRLTSIVLLFSLSLSLHAAENNPLPDIGNPSSAGMTPANEKQLGASLLRWLRQNNLISNDPIIQSYIHSLGYQLVANSDESRQPYTFFVVNDPSINAFAAPGGYIGIHTGLILTTETEDELAGVMAHEIAHITQRHMARTYQSAKRHQLATAVALLAAVLIGQNVDQLTEAALVTATAANAQLQINFTRSNEKEADYIGIKTLANAGFNPSGMPAFFERMQKATRLYSERELPEFLRTHPVTVNRIADSRSRARTMHYKPHSQQSVYAYIKARVQVHKSDDIKQFILQYKNDHHVKKDSSVYNYTLAIAHLKADQASEAQSYIKKLISKKPESLIFRIAQAQIQQKLGQTKKAFNNYSAMLRLYPYSHVITLYFSEHLLATNKASTAYRVLREYTRNRTPDNLILKRISQAANALGKTGEAYLYLAETEYLNGNTHTAINHLETALKNTHNDYYLTSKIEARMSEYKKMALKEKK